MMPYNENNNDGVLIGLSIEAFNRALDREFEETQCSNFDDRKYRFLCIEVKNEPDSSLEWIGIKC